MGFLSDGKALPWEEAKKWAEFIRTAGLEQFLRIWNTVKDRSGDRLTWGDEIEYILVHVDPNSNSTKLSLRAPEILEELMKDELQNKNPNTCWRPEYGSFMLESTPGFPYTARTPDLLRVQANMELRRKVAEELLEEGERILSLTVYPMMGVGNYTEPAPREDWTPGSSEYSKSLFIQDEIINPHPRFGTLSANIRKRRQKTVDINVPLFKDKNTKPMQYGPEHLENPPPEYLVPPEGALPDHIYMDAMAFGMGCCCLQCTFQCCNIDEARLFYDQLSTLCPVMMALTASAPVFRGYLADTDVRWSVISSSVDDRTREERGLEPLKDCKYVIPKSRYDSISAYISRDSTLTDEMNDLDIPINQEAYDVLVANDIDPLLARHIAHLFIRDPLVIYDKRIKLDPETSSDHFENIQSTNWQTVRFKPPPPKSTIGWRVEFRSMEVSLTAFENAAFAIFVVLVSRVISAFESNFYIPLSKTDENMKRGHRRNAVLNEKFYFRDNCDHDSENSYSEKTIDEIINGKADGFIGLIPLIEVYLDTVKIDPNARLQLDKYLKFIGKRASGEYVTTATWMREFITNHPDYKQDSVVTHQINHDLLEACYQISIGQLEVPNLLPPEEERKLPEGSPAV